MLSRPTYPLFSSLCLILALASCHEDVSVTGGEEEVVLKGGELANAGDRAGVEVISGGLSALDPLAGAEGGAESGGSALGGEQGGAIATLDLGMMEDMSPELAPDLSMMDLDMGEPPSPQEDIGPPAAVLTPFVQGYWSATHNSYEGEERGSILEQLRSGVRALELDVHDNDFRSEGYRIGHFQYGDAVAHGEENPDTDSLSAWLDVINEWSQNNPEHAPIILTIDLKDNLMDNKSFAEGNLSKLNDVLSTHINRLWQPRDGLDDLDAARGHTLCILSGDGGTRRGYLHDKGASPALNINSSGVALEVHDSRSGSLWYWSGIITSADGLLWRRHGEYDSGRRPSVLLSPTLQVIEVHQSEARDTLWASTGSLSSQGELTLESASRFSDGTWPSLQWRDQGQGLFTLRYIRNGEVYEREGSADFNRSSISWGSERATPAGTLIFSRSASIYQGATYQVSDDGATDGYPASTLWMSVSDGGQRAEAPIRYAQLCFVEWQREEHRDPLLGQQAFGALPGGDYSALPEGVRDQYIIRGWQFNGRDSEAPVPQLPSTDYPYEESYQQLMESLGAL